MVIRFSRGDVIALAGSPFFLFSLPPSPPPPSSLLSPPAVPSLLYFISSLPPSFPAIHGPMRITLDGLMVVKFAIGRFLFIRPHRHRHYLSRRRKESSQAP